MSLCLLLVSSMLTACGEGDIETNLPTSSIATTTSRRTTTSFTPTTEATTTTVGVDPKEASFYRVSTVGIGEVIWGMKQSRAEAEYGALFTGTIVDPFCFVVTPTDGPRGITFVVSNTRIERVDISVAGITTKSGAGIGWTENEVRAQFGENIEINEIETGNELIYVPSDSRDAEYRIIFASDGEKIVSMRAGKLPEVAPTEPCGS